MVAKTWAENIWRESVRTVLGLLPLRNGSRFIASVLSAMKIHDEYRLNGTKMTSKWYFFEHKFNFNIS